VEKFGLVVDEDDEVVMVVDVLGQHEVDEDDEVVLMDECEDLELIQHE